MAFRTLNRSVRILLQRIKNNLLTAAFFWKWHKHLIAAFPKIRIILNCIEKIALKIGNWIQSIRS